MSRFIASFLFLLSTLFSPNLSALSIGEHSQITSIAIQYYEQCTGLELSSWMKRILVASNLEEDINLPLKWAMYSHFYNPHKELKSYRYGSLARVAIEQNRILQNIDTTNDRYWDIEFKARRLGHILHHLQDATSPSHVVPVQHWLNDSYETLSETNSEFYLSLMEFLAQSPPDCSFLFLPKIVPSEILRLTAIDTLNSIRSPIEYLINNEPMKGSWELFWQESEGDFGQYGVFGNKFGSTLFNLEDGTIIEISEDTYFAFRLNGALRAIHASTLTLHWFFNDLQSKTDFPLVSSPL